MPPGYAIAACLECAGAFGIVLALRLLRAEQRAKAGELARFLRSGQIPDLAPSRMRTAATTRASQPIRLEPSPSTGPTGPSGALLALRSAYGAPGT